MEKKFNVKYGVVNVEKRTEYEKRTHSPFPYDLITPKKSIAIFQCKKKNNTNYIVEEIFDTPKAKGKRNQIYRSGSYEDYMKG